MANYTATALKQAYWYKIGGKTVTKAQYNAYENPVGDGPTKSTNDPDASGRLAKREVTRANNKASKRPTALTKEQTKLKDQGTKAPRKRPPFKQKLNGKKLPKGYTKKDAKFLKNQREDVVRYEDLDAKGKAIWKKQGKPVPKKKPPLNYSKTPLNFDWKSALDYGQTALTAAGTIPGVGIIADGINTATSLGRAGYAKATGDKQGVKDHMINAGVNAAMMVPVVGQGVAGTKLAYSAGKEVVKQGGKKLAKEAGKRVVKKAVNKGTSKVLKDASDAIATKKANSPKGTRMTMLNNGKRVKNTA